MQPQMTGVLFLCTGNSARSILAESILQKDGAGRFRAYSAGSRPKGEVNPLALKVLRDLGYPADGFRSKSWDEFAAPGAPRIDVIVTVCNNAAGETCPIWPGRPITAHWGIADPKGEDAFREAARLMRMRIGAFLNLPSNQANLDAIGGMEGATRGTL
jgi:arsenate reductase (thioredoxin)